MKSLIAIAALAFLASPAWAHDQDGNPDLSQSITNVHASHFPHIDGDEHGPERGEGDQYGSILLDLQAGERHVPHMPGDNHAPERGEGDNYGSILNDLG